MDPGVLTPQQVADELGVTVRTVQRWIRNGRMPARRIGGRLRVSRSSLAAVATGGPGERGPGGVPRPIGCLLVANRGEIAARVARSATGLGIRVVHMVAADEPAPRCAHESVTVSSYLAGDEIIAAARGAVADAIHPGYGFLAESADFARAVTDAGLTWIGPPPDAIAAMGDKAQARRRAEALNVPVLPGYDGPDQTDASLAAAASRIGVPLLVKPAAGGGGKGMHVVRGAADLPEALAAARREAHRAFGDERLILERYVDGGRHVEIQVLYDRRGAGVHLGERDCSAQRRAQKVVEEAPAPYLNPSVRAAMCDAALAVATAIGYESAGTVEFLVSDDGAFFFIEMNTRLQVEHPVTEAVTGRDLVADQLRIASGDDLATLGLAAPPRTRGHAIEARLYAEDPEAGFLPATGRVAAIRWPDGVRVDAGITEGDMITDRYDPLLAKLIAAGPDRTAALRRLTRALAETSILGVRTNVRFLRWLLASEPLTAGRMRTDTLAQAEIPAPPAPDEAAWEAAASLLIGHEERDPWGGAWRLNAPPRVRVAYGDEERTVSLGGGRATRGGTALGEAAIGMVELPRAARDESLVHVDVEGQSLSFGLAPAPTVDAALRHASAGAHAGAVLTAPMPGRVISVRATEGATVRAREPIVVLEAMKMEHAVAAAIDGIVTRLLVREGQQVERGEALAEVAAAETPTDS
jgi:acetyl-CoA/propionyl-CoA carboxylase biotin carboxyl carrier protein